MDRRTKDGVHRYLDRQNAEAIGSRKDPRLLRHKDWAIEQRQQFARLIGVVDPRLPADMERFGTDANPALVAETSKYRIYQVRWPVLEGDSRVTGEGLLLTPIKNTVGHIIALPDAVWTPEDICGLTDEVPAESQYARRLAEAGFEVIVPVLIDRASHASGNPAIRMTGKPHREWIYHMAYQMGRHVIGYDVQRTLAAVDWFKKQYGDKAKIGVVGVGEGGLVAFYAAAIDPRIDAALVSGYFRNRNNVWREPIYRNVWGLLEFGDAGIANLIAPRGLVVEHSAVNEIKGRREPAYPDELVANEGRAAGGELLTPSLEAVEKEFGEIHSPLEKFPRVLIKGEADRPVSWGSPQALNQFIAMLRVPFRFPETNELVAVSDDIPLMRRVEIPREMRTKFDPVARQGQQVKEAENHVQWLLRNADRTRDKFFLNRTDRKTPEAFAESVKKHGFKKYMAEEILGRISEPLQAPNPRSRKIYDRPKWLGYEVVLDVVPDVMAYGILLMPKDLKPGEKRPVVVCQHGRNGMPQDTIEGDNKAYHDFAAKLADRGFIVFAPHNLYRTEQRYRWLQRKANPLKLSMFSFIVLQHDQILRWLASRPEVDPARIAFYGLSYGGETAVRVPPLLDGYCLSICSADYNDWARRVADSHSPYGYPFHDEWEMPYFNMGNTLNYAELAALMIPRPFMVERGSKDGVGPDEWVAYEYAKVRRLYNELGIGDRTEIEFFNGPHTINGVGTFKFLHKQLQWPEK
ncbi:MAG: dienelactone hydrolase family protein [Planctomycetes bacterium]|nr:dienelactone hydrolase family protein [Planctomycetota bacterium]